MGSLNVIHEGKSARIELPDQQTASLPEKILLMTCAMLALVMTICIAVWMSPKTVAFLKSPYWTPGDKFLLIVTTFLLIIMAIAYVGIYSVFALSTLFSRKFTIDIQDRQVTARFSQGPIKRQTVVNPIRYICLEYRPHFKNAKPLENRKVDVLAFSDEGYRKLAFNLPYPLALELARALEIEVGRIENRTLYCVDNVDEHAQKPDIPESESHYVAQDANGVRTLESRLPTMTLRKFFSRFKIIWSIPIAFGSLLVVVNCVPELRMIAFSMVRLLLFLMGLLFLAILMNVKGKTRFEIDQGRLSRKECYGNFCFTSVSVRDISDFRVDKPRFEERFPWRLYALNQKGKRTLVHQGDYVQMSLLEKILRRELGLAC